MLWNLFCRVIDNHGDVGVCWRLAADLASRGEDVQLVIDDASALAWMAPEGADRVRVVPWSSHADSLNVGDVVIEAFGCELPVSVVQRMAARPTPPVWINLEYLSAERYVERSHRLASPPSNGPGSGLRKWFFYPGFTDATGGLIREVDLAERQRAFDPAAWLTARGLVRQDGERIVSLFCYEQPALAVLIDELAQRPTLLLATAGYAAEQTERLLGPNWRRGALRCVPLSLVAQRDYDHLLWSSDLNFVRGEDSFVRAQWAGKPFVWQIYSQHDGVHAIKLDAFLARFTAGQDEEVSARVCSIFHAWNGIGATTLGPWPLQGDAAWQRLCVQWRSALLAQADLVSRLLGFVAESR